MRKLLIGLIVVLVIGAILYFRFRKPHGPIGVVLERRAQQVALPVRPVRRVKKGQRGRPVRASG